MIPAYRIGSREPLPKSPSLDAFASRFQPPAPKLP